MFSLGSVCRARNQKVRGVARRRRRPKMSVDFLIWSFQVFEIPRKKQEIEILLDLCLLKTHCACVRSLLERATDDKVISSYSLLPFAAILITNASVADQLLCVYAPSSVTTSCAQKLRNPVLYILTCRLVDHEQPCKGITLPGGPSTYFL